MLIDQIIKSGEHFLRQPTELESFLFARLREAEVIFADNVARYLYCETPQEDWDIARDFPNAAPPFPVMFVEHSLPRYSLSEKLGRINLDSTVKKQGTLILSRKVEREDPELEREGDIQHIGLKRALHICRGHFKDYTIGKGLFGKVRGCFGGTWQ